MVVKVEFSDGTAWEANRQQFRLLWNDSIRPESARSCENSPGIAETLKQVKGGTYSGAPPAQSSSETIQSYSVACPVRTIQGVLAVACKW